MYINIITAFSNLIAYLYIYYYEKSINYMLNCIILCSFLDHLAEIKHNLPGISILNKYSNVFFMLNIIFSIYGLYFIFSNFNKLELYDIPIGIFGLICLLISELDTIIQKVKNTEYKIHIYYFLFFHNIWHFCVYYIYVKCL